MNRSLRIAACTIPLVVLIALPALALTGNVHDPEGKPIEGAKVCYLLGGSEGICVLTDKQGFYEMPSSSVDRIQITMKGYLPRTVAAVQQSAPIALQRAGALWVKLIDSTGDPLASGEIFLILPSGARKGPFPVNAKGVRIRTLPVETYRIVARVPGYTQSKTASVELEPGKERVFELALETAESPGD